MYRQYVNSFADYGVVDNVTGDVYISYGEARKVLGLCHKIPGMLQGLVIKELVEADLLIVVNKQTLKISCEVLLD